MKERNFELITVCTNSQVDHIAVGLGVTNRQYQ